MNAKYLLKDLNNFATERGTQFFTVTLCEWFGVRVFVFIVCRRFRTSFMCAMGSVCENHIEQTSNTKTVCVCVCVCQKGKNGLYVRDGMAIRRVMP